MSKLLILTFLYFIPAPQLLNQCELEAVSRANRFADTYNQYNVLRQQGIRNAKLRKQLPEQLDRALQCECF